MRKQDTVYFNMLSFYLLLLFKDLPVEIGIIILIAFLIASGIVVGIILILHYLGRKLKRTVIGRFVGASLLLVFSIVITIWGVKEAIILIILANVWIIIEVKATVKYG